MSTLNVAIVGAGPAGFYAADALLRKSDGCSIDILDRLPTPYGLVRAGVAPDHQSTKNVTRVYDRILQNDAVRLIGNVTLGSDVTYDELKAIYDVVILAIGAQAPRQLGIPGESLFGVVDCTSFVNWYNAVPGALDLSEEIDAETAIVVGNGNVALDIARLLAKTMEEMAASDIDGSAAAAITAAKLTDIYVVGRRGPLQASFTSPELTEFGDLTDAVPIVDPGDLPESADDVPDKEKPKKEKNLRILKQYAELDTAADSRPVKIHLAFFASPLEILGDDRVTGVRFERNLLENGRPVPTGEHFEIDAQLFVSAIGYFAASEGGGPPIDEARGTVRNENGRIEPGAYVVGWARRGPTGVIGTNRNDAREVVDHILEDGIATGKAGPAGLDSLFAERGTQATTYDDWKRIDAAEIAAGGGDRPRVKFTDIDEMLDAARQDPGADADAQ
jgi:ferredoxin--NADP+ reductase